MYRLNKISLCWILVINILLSIVFKVKHKICQHKMASDFVPFHWVPNWCLHNPVVRSWTQIEGSNSCTFYTCNWGCLSCLSCGYPYTHLAGCVSPELSYIFIGHQRNECTTHNYSVGTCVLFYWFTEMYKCSVSKIQSIVWHILCNPTSYTIIDQWLSYDLITLKCLIRSITTGMKVRFSKSATHIPKINSGVSSSPWVPNRSF